MNATEAKAKADLFHTERLSKEKENTDKAVAFILKQIAMAAESGEYTISIGLSTIKDAYVFDTSLSLMRSIISELEKVYGYKVNKAGDSNFSCTIKWDNL